MFVGKEDCANCGRPLNVTIDTSEGVPSQAHVECDCGAISHYLIGWEPRVWVSGGLGIDLPAVAQSNKRLQSDASPVVSAEK